MFFFLVPNIPGKCGDIVFSEAGFSDTGFSVTGVKKTPNPKSKSKNKKLQCFGHKRFFSEEVATTSQNAPTKKWRESP